MTAKTVLIPVPSGRLVFANDLRPLTGHVKNHSLNSESGRAAMSVQYSFYGVGHVFIGDALPHVVRSENGLHVQSGLAPGTLGVVDRLKSCYSVMDADMFSRRCAVLGVDPETFKAFTVEVSPGAYTLTLEDVDPDDGPVILSKISWVDIPCDLLPQDEPDFGVAETFETSAIWEQLNALPWGLNSNVEFIFTTLGNAIDWHHGHLADLSGHEKDAPFRQRLPKSTDVDADLARVPELPGFEPGLRMAGAEGRSYTFAHGKPPCFSGGMSGCA